MSKKKAIICSKCGKPMLERENDYYCMKDDVLIKKTQQEIQPSSRMVEMPCTSCGKQLQYLEESKAWYCLHCDRKFIPSPQDPSKLEEIEVTRSLSPLEFGLQDDEVAVKTLGGGWRAVRHGRTFEWSKSMFRFDLLRKLVLTNQRIVLLKDDVVEYEVPLENVREAVVDRAGIGNPYIRIDTKDNDVISIALVNPSPSLLPYSRLAEWNKLTQEWANAINEQRRWYHELQSGTGVVQKSGKSPENQVRVRQKKSDLTKFVIGLLLILVVALPVVVWISTIPKGGTFTIQIQSDTNWSGSIGADGNSRTVEGSGSRNFQVSGTIASAAIQKRTDYGFLTVSIIRNGLVLASQTTTAAYGVVTVASSSSQSGTPIAQPTQSGTPIPSQVPPLVTATVSLTNAQTGAGTLTFTITNPSGAPTDFFYFQGRVRIGVYYPVYPKEAGGTPVPTPPTQEVSLEYENSQGAKVKVLGTVTYSGSSFTLKFVFDGVTAKLTGPLSPIDFGVPYTGKIEVCCPPKGCTCLIPFSITIPNP